jgi:hypothetical protein
LAYTAGIISLSVLLGLTIPAVATSVAAINSHSTQLDLFPGSPGYQDHIGPGYLTFWTNNATLASNLPPPGQTVTGTIGVGLANGTTYHYNCYWPNIVDREPAGTLPPKNLGGNESFTTLPAPGYVLVVIDLSQYCQLTNVTNG